MRVSRMAGTHTYGKGWIQEYLKKFVWETPVVGRSKELARETCTLREIQDESIDITYHRNHRQNSHSYMYQTNRHRYQPPTLLLSIWLPWAALSARATPPWRRMYPATPRFESHSRIALGVTRIVRSRNHLPYVVKMSRMSLLHVRGHLHACVGLWG